MPAELLVKAQTSGFWEKGAIVSVRPGGWIWGASETLPSFVQLTISNATYKQVGTYFGRWRLSVDVQEVSRNNASARLKVSASPVRISDAFGQITEAQAQPFLDAINATFVSADNSGVTFDVTAFGVATSEQAIGPTGNVTFTDNGFSGGVQTVQADYSGYDANAVSARVMAAGFDIESNDGSSIVYYVTVDQIRELIQEFMEAPFSNNELAQQLSTSRYKFSNQAVNQAINAGGQRTVTVAQAQAALEDALDG